MVLTSDPGYTARMTKGTIDIAIVGGGLSGLALAEQLVAQGRDVHLFEARGRLGGRILGAGAGFDMGPAWVWPHNRRMLGLIDRLGLEVFAQHATGNLVHEDATGAVRRDLAFSTMAGALRCIGGLTALIDRLVTRLPYDRVHLGHRLDGQTSGPKGHKLAITTPVGEAEIQASTVVLALPPRIVAERIAVTPGLPPGLHDAMRATPTWMAGHAKLVAVYARPFWREAGLSGDGISQRGPLAEIHDASPANGDTGALFGFVATPPKGRMNAEGVKGAAIDQLAGMFGAEAATPQAVYWQDWAHEPETATSADHAPLTAHPHYGLLPGMDALATRGVHLAGTEVAPEDGGFLEGALAAAEATCAILSN